MSAPKNLTQTERLSFMNQYKILAALHPEESDYYERVAEIFEMGYSTLYYEAFQHMRGDELDPEIAEEVFDILQVHRNMVWSCEHLGISDSGFLDAIKFRGFDGNNEPEYLGFAEFIQEKLKKFNEQPILNSHAPLLEMYRGRVAQWKAKGKKNDLSRADIEEIIEAGTKRVRS